MIPNGADLDIVKPAPRDNWVSQKHNLTDKFVVTYVGAHGRANHLIQLLDAAIILKEEDPQVLLMLVGDGMEKPMLKDKARQWGLDNVLFVDPVPKSVITDYLSASDVCTAVLKKVDTFKTVYPNKVFDYMAVARPVIIAIDGVARSLIQDAQAGIYTEPENANEFAQAVVKLKSDPALCEKYGRSGLRFVRKNFDRRVLADRYLDIIANKVITGQGSKC